MGKRESTAAPLPEEILRELSALREKAIADFSGALEEKALEQARVAHLGMKGTVARVLERIPKLAPELRRTFGAQANSLKVALEGAYEAGRAAAARAQLERELQGERLDVTLPGRRERLGRRHPVSRTVEDICAVFSRLGFDVATGPEIEFDYYSFEALNIPADHPARDMQDTFYIDSAGLSEEARATTVVLRPHTSPVQIRTMLARKPPVRIIAPGKVYRCDSDVSHTPMFHQVEGLLVDKGVTFAELKGTLESFVHTFFGPETRTRFRPSYFPFTEPSAEVDISCVLCSGKGCRVCKQTGWLEVLGSGMVHPNVFKAVGYDPEAISGYAFGMGVERIALLRYGLDDLRTLFENDARFLDQF
jgi:phenylalanyl-tRNA synthetase alpha chain